MRPYNILRSLLRARRTWSESLAGSAKPLTYSQLKQTRRFSSNPKKQYGDVQEKNDDRNLVSAINTKYKVFRDADADVILDVSEEQQRIELEKLNAHEEFHDPYVGINLNHGVTGVFDIEDLITLLERDKAMHIFVAWVPKDYAYVDYIVVVTGKSYKHMSALATFVRKVYKLKRYQTEGIPKIEGPGSKDWIALDLGNIALHIFSESARKSYDLETLWTVGSQYDDKTNVPDEEIDIMDQYKAFLTDLQPADSSSQY